MRGSGRDGRKRAGAAAKRRPTPRRRGSGSEETIVRETSRGKISRPRWIPGASGKTHVWRFFARRTRGRAARRRARGGIATARGTIFRIARRWRDGCVLVRVGTRAVRLVGARKRAAQTVRGAVTRQKAISFAGKNENAAGFAPRAPRRRGGRVDSATPKTRVRTCEVHHGEALLCAPRVTAEVHVLAEQLDRRRARQGHLGGCLGRAALQTLGDGDGILAICREDDLLRDGIDVRFVDIHSLGLVVAISASTVVAACTTVVVMSSAVPRHARVRLAFFSRRRARRSGRDASSTRAPCETVRARYPQSPRARFLGKARPVRRAQEGPLVTMTPSSRRSVVR